MEKIEFTPITKNNKNLGHPQNKILVEFPTGPVNLGGAPIRYEKIEFQEVAGKRTRTTLSTQSVMDRLLSYLSTGDPQGLDSSSVDS